MMQSIIAWRCNCCGKEISPQFRPHSAVLCRECNHIVCRGCLAVKPARDSEYAVCRSCAESVAAAESDDDKSESDEPKGWRESLRQVLQRARPRR